jgi:GNAT superfamily N-acetyltransferase
MPGSADPVLPNSRRLFELQLELECVRVTADHTLVPIPCPNPDGPARFVVAHYANGWHVYFRHDMSDQLRRQLAALPPEQAFHDRDRVKALLAQDAPCAEIWAGKAYTFPAMPDSAPCPEVVRLDGHESGLTAYGASAGGRTVATCSSSRENDRCAEAWVHTEPEFRRRGYARLVTAAWAQDIQRQGKIPFYSHLIDNAASRGVARSLGLSEFLVAVGYS